MRRWQALALVLALVAGASTWAWWSQRQLAADRAAAADVAVATAEAIFTYDHSDREAWAQRLGRVATADFTQAYEQRFLDEVWPQVEATGATSSATAQPPTVGQRDGARIDAVVATNVRVEGTDGTRSSLTWLQVELVADAGGERGWLARDVRIITTAPTDGS